MVATTETAGAPTGDGAAWEGVRHSLLACPTSHDPATSDLSPAPQFSIAHTQNMSHLTMTVDTMLFFLYTHHVLDCTRYLAHVYPTSYHNPSTQLGVSISSPCPYSLFACICSSESPHFLYEKPLLFGALLLRFCADFVLEQLVASFWFCLIFF